MFDVNNIKNLFLVSISDLYPDNNIVTDNVDDFLKFSIAGYGYSTIRKRNNYYQKS